jgi:organic radical activating enzyme
MGKDLKAENLAVSVPNLGCNKNCHFCVSRMTGYMDHDYELMMANTPKVVKVAETAEVTSVLFTGKGEPLINNESIYNIKYLAYHFNRWPLEIQTNGVSLATKAGLQIIDQLADMKFNTIALSVNSYEEMQTMVKKIHRKIAANGMILRVTVNATKEAHFNTFATYISFCAEYGVRQLTFRRITIPDNPKCEKTAQWIRDNVKQGYYDDQIGEAVARQYQGRKIRTMNSGIEIWDLHGVAFAFSDYCIQEHDNGDNIRSLIFQEDGHLYTSWNSKASILF